MLSPKTTKRLITYSRIIHVSYCPEEDSLETPWTPWTPRVLHFQVVMT
jgi:hypothetical protein